MSELKTLFFDIETAGVNALKSDLGFVIVFGYKWAHENKARAITIDGPGLKKFSDKKVLTEASAILAEADIVIGHYASVFDRRFIQGRLLINRLPMIPQAKMRDTVFKMRGIANFSSNRLKHLAKILDLKNQKLENNWPTAWFKVMQGDMKALRGLAHYCKGDVLALEELYNLIESYYTPKGVKFRLAQHRQYRTGPMSTPCWIWTGALKNKRYGSISVEGKSRLVHVVAYELYKGKCSDDLDLDHLCKEPTCFNPDHLEPVAHAENCFRGNHKNRLKTHCPKGHEYITRLRKSSGRMRRDCNECHRLHKAAVRAKLKEAA